MMERPAAVLIDISKQSAHHCQVPSASPSVKSRPHRCDNCAAVGPQPSGFQPSGGFCMKEAAAIATIPYAIPKYANVSNTPVRCISHPAAGAEIKDPAPNLATAIPVMSPRQSGNHFTRTEIGTI